MAFENLNIEPDEAPEAPPPNGNGGNNRTFITIAGILAGVTLVALVLMALYAFLLLPQRRAKQEAQLASLNLQNTQVAQAITQTSVASFFTATPTATRIPATATITPTPVVAKPTNTSVAAQADPRTATVAALLTQAAGIQRTPVAQATTTALPATGFADEVGVPGMLSLSVVLIVVIFLARRLRTVS
jgi:hypothetical protein